MENLHVLFVVLAQQKEAPQRMRTRDKKTVACAISFSAIVYVVCPSASTLAVTVTRPVLFSVILFDAFAAALLIASCIPLTLTPSVPTCPS